MFKCQRCGKEIKEVCEVDLKIIKNYKMVEYHSSAQMCEWCAAQFARTFSAYNGGVSKRVDWRD